MNRLVKIALVGALVAGAGISAAYTEPSGFAGGPSQRQFERFCGMDVTYFSDRIANRLTKRLNLTDVQKPVLKDLQDTFIKVRDGCKGSVQRDT